jgi:AcrR family transcriptional regulator
LDLISGRRERKKDETKRKIIDVALEMFHRQGFAATTMEQIADTADVAKGTLYNHFATKEAIVGEYMRRTVRENEPDAVKFFKELPDTRSRLYVFMEKIAEWTELNKEIVGIYVSYRMQNLFRPQDERERSGFESLLAKIIGHGQASGELRKNISQEKLVKYFEVLHAMTLRNWLVEPEEFPLQQNLIEAVDLFLTGAKEQ